MKVFAYCDETILKRYTNEGQYFVMVGGVIGEKRTDIEWRLIYQSKKLFLFRRVIIFVTF